MKNFAKWTLGKNIYTSSSGNMAVQHTVATVLHAAVALMLEGLSGTRATVGHGSDWTQFC